jgi:hypothetical protein
MNIDPVLLVNLIDCCNCESAGMICLQNGIELMCLWEQSHRIAIMHTFSGGHSGYSSGQVLLHAFWLVIIHGII